MHAKVREAPDGPVGTLVAGVGAGAAGTAVMTATARMRRERYARRRGLAAADLTEIVDYDDSEHVVVAASTVLRGLSGWAPHSSGGRRALFWLVHWGYGSAVGAAHAGLYRLIGREPAAGLAFFTGCQAMALGLFPVLGGTPRPWRWQRRLLVVSLVQHGVYAGVVTAANAGLRRFRSPAGAPSSVR